MRLYVYYYHDYNDGTISTGFLINPDKVRDFITELYSTAGCSIEPEDIVPVDEVMKTLDEIGDIDLAYDDFIMEIRRLSDAEMYEIESNFIQFRQWQQGQQRRQA